MKKLLFILFLLPLFTNAATKYIDPSAAGSTEDGSLANPYLSIAEALTHQASFNAGDFILLKRGQVFSGGGFTITKGGSIGNPITYGAYGSGARPMLIGTGSTITSLFTFSGPDYVTFTDIDVSDPTLDSDDEDRVLLANIQRVFTVYIGSTNIICQYMEVQQVGVGVFWEGSNNNMEYCHYFNMRMVENDPGGINDFGCNPVTIASSNNIVSHCEFGDLAAPSFDFGWDGGAIEVFSGSVTMSNNTIEYCLIYDGIGVSEITGNTNGFYWYYNIFINCGSVFNFQSGYSHPNTYTYNNVFVLTEASPVGDTKLFYGDVEDMTVKNSIFYMRGGCDLFHTSASPSAVVHSYNYLNLGTGSDAGWTIGGTEINDNSSALWQTMSGDPITWNYHLATGSPAIGAGTTIGGLSTTDFGGNSIGSPPNMGVYGPAITPTSSTITFPATINNGSGNKMYPSWKN